jgi:hypothetical protein
MHKYTNHICRYILSLTTNKTMGSFNTSFVFMHTREASAVSAYDLYIYAKVKYIGLLDSRYLKLPTWIIARPWE